MSPYVTVNLLSVAPKVHQVLLLGDVHLSERRIRSLVSNPAWNSQRDVSVEKTTHVE